VTREEGAELIGVLMGFAASCILTIAIVAMVAP